MTEPAVQGARARARAELTAEILSTARAQLIDVGASELSLRAVARELGMASSAVYRYFASRDELLTALIIDAYDRIGEAVETAASTGKPRDFAGRWLTIGRAVRSWALANPQEYALIYGSPVPGYAAPDDTIGPATRIPAVMLKLLADIDAADRAPDLAAPPRALRAELAAMADVVDGSFSPALAAAGLAAWAELFGLINLELFGHFHNVITDTDALFDHTLRQRAASLMT